MLNAYLSSCLVTSSIFYFGMFTTNRPNDRQQMKVNSRNDKRQTTIHRGRPKEELSTG